MPLKKRIIKNAVIIFVILILLGVLTVVCTRIYMVEKERAKIYEHGWEMGVLAQEDGPYDAIIVLGAGVYRDGTLSPMLQYRMEKTVECWETGAASMILVTGDHRTGEYDEVDHMIEYLREHGVPEEVIDYDYNGYSTYESMVHAAEYYDIHRAVVVTQRYHLYRAMYDGESRGLELTGIAAENWQMSAGTVMRTIREWFACMKDLWCCIRKVDV